jgi:hypothetical protein
VSQPIDGRHVIARYFDMWNGGDTSIADGILCPDWLDHAHPEIIGVDGVRQAVRSIRNARPDLWFQLDAILGAGDLLAAVGSVGRAPHTGARPSQIIWLVRLSNGRMSEMWTYHEDLG